MGFWSRLLSHSRSFSSAHPSLRNIAIIAHVDHGKTSLVNSLLAFSNITSHTLDSNQLEKERGITILSKLTTLTYKDTKINILDTPGHSDFGGEVERVLSLVDGVCLVVDATKGPMTQTRFVLEKALQRKCKPMVIFNKCDRPSVNIDQIDSDVFDLFLKLGYEDDYKVVYTSARDGWASLSSKEKGTDMGLLLETIIQNIPPPSLPEPKENGKTPFKSLICQLESDPFLGQLALGRIIGPVAVNQNVQVMNSQGVMETGRITNILTRHGMERIQLPSAQAGDIVYLAGLANVAVNATLCDQGLPPSERIEEIYVDPPTLSIRVAANDSPLAGKEGKHLTSNKIKERLMQEARVNIALSVEEIDNNSFQVNGRGELQLGVLLETMRREGFEVQVSAPKVLFKSVDHVQHEPIEQVYIEVDSELASVIIERLQRRKGEMVEYVETEDGKIKLNFNVPTRGLLGFRTEFKNVTRGEGIINNRFLEYQPYKGDLDSTKKNYLISMADGMVTPYALQGLEARGELWIKPGDDVYKGMIVGVASKEGELFVNPTKKKALTNVRAAGKEGEVRLRDVKDRILEECVVCVADGEVVEITPGIVRMRKLKMK